MLDREVLGSILARRTAGAAPPRALARGGRGDQLFLALAWLCGAATVGLLLFLTVTLLFDAWPALQRFGLRFLTASEWDPVFESFGTWPYIYGTLMTSAVALTLATPVAVGGAIYLAEYAPPWVRQVVGFVVELLAAIPSVIYGLWGFFVLAPVMRGAVEPLLKTTFGGWPLVGGLFSGPALGKDILTAGVILAIMILPTVLSVAREVLQAVPPAQREGMLALGATRWETIQHAVLPYARAGIAGGAMLGLARALGETMAVTMVIGNSSRAVTGSLLTPGYTMASAIANQFTEADKAIYFSAVVGIGLVLLLVATIINLLARLLIHSIARGPRGIRA